MTRREGKKTPLRIREATVPEAYAHLLASAHDPGSLQAVLDQIKEDPRLTPAEKEALRITGSRRLSTGP